MKVALYVRTSTIQQNTELQKSELESYALSQGWEIYDLYEDQATGTNDNRPNLKRLISDMEANKFDCIAVWKLDRFSRSLQHLLATLQRASELDIAFFSLKDNIDLTTTTGRLIMQILGAFAEFEASLIRTRVKAGIENFKREHGRWGRGKSVNQRLIFELAKTGKTQREIAMIVGCSPASVCRILKLFNTKVS